MQNSTDCNVVRVRAKRKWRGLLDYSTRWIDSNVCDEGGCNVCERLADVGGPIYVIDRRVGIGSQRGVVGEYDTRTGCDRECCGTSSSRKDTAVKEPCGEHTFKPAETGGVRVRPVVLGEVQVVRASRGVDVACGGVGGNPERADRLHLEVRVGTECAGDEGITTKNDIRSVSAKCRLVS